MVKKTRKAKALSPSDMEENFQAESDVRTLIDAEKIKRDKPRLTRAMKKVREQRDALASVANTKGKET